MSSTTVTGDKKIVLLSFYWIIVVHFFVAAIASNNEETSSSPAAVDENSTQLTAEDASETAAAAENPLRRAYSRCGSDLGGKLVTCDPDHTLRSYNVRKKIDDILWRMQTEVPCYCESISSCRRYDDFPIQSGVTAVFVSFTGGDLPDTSEEDARSISEEISRITRRTNSNSNTRSSSSKLDDMETSAITTATSNNNDTCDNRLVLIYAIDTRALYLHAGSAIDRVFDYLPIRRRRIEPNDLTPYLEQMLVTLQKKLPESVAIRQLAVPGAGGAAAAGGGRNWSTAGLEIVVGMIAAIVLVAIAVAVLVSLCLTSCCYSCCGGKGGGLRKKSELEIRYADELASYRRYEKECKEWTKRAKYLAKRRVKMLRTMQKSDWDAKVEAAKSRLMNHAAKTTGSSSTLGGGGGETSGAAAGQQNPRSTTPYYIVTEPASTLSRVANVHHQQQPASSAAGNNWGTLFNMGNGRGGENAGGSDYDDDDTRTIRSDRRIIADPATAGTASSSLGRKSGGRRKRETQRCDIYIGTKE